MLQYKMDMTVFEKLHAEGMISNQSLQKLQERQQNNLLSVHWELRTLLYLGVLLLTTGLGIIVYKNIDTIGHQAILAAIVLISGGSFYYCYQKKNPFSAAKVEAPNAWFDYVLLLGCLTFISFVGYLQYQYNVFGNRYGLATFIPMLLLFFAAYYFDHLGILCLAITNLAAWAGIAITPAKIIRENEFDNASLIFTGLLLGILLIVAGTASRKMKFKPHFQFTYTNFGMHLSFIACLAAMFHFDGMYLLWLLVLAGIGYFFYRKAFSEKSFYYILALTLYLYIGVCYAVMQLLFYRGGADMLSIYAALIYFIGSGIGLILFLINMNKKIKSA